MENGKKIALGVTVVLLLAVGIRFALIYRDRQAANEEPKKADSGWVVTADDMVHLKHLYPSSMKDAKDLTGKTVWVSAGGQLDFYPYVGKRAQYNTKAGTLLGAEPLAIKDMVQQVAPPKATPRVPVGDRQVLAVFTRANDTKEYAAPIGFVENGQYTFYLDELFFYDDPHVLYKHWGPENWAAIDKHEARLGMSENMAMLALGQVSSSGSQKKGDRTVNYFNLGKPYDVTFVKDKATKIEAVKQ